jgi:pyruvate-formate lyase
MITQCTIADRRFKINPCRPYFRLQYSVLLGVLMPKRESIHSPFSSYAPDYAEVKVLENVPNFDLELEFTQAYRQNIHAHVAIREARCLQVLFPKVFQAIQPGDVFAGRTRYRQIGFGLENASGGPGYYCYADNLVTEMENSPVDASTHQQLEAAMALWETEATITGKLIPSLPEDVYKYTSNPIASMGGRLSGAMLDFKTLVRIGLPGLRERVERGKERALREGGDVQLFEGMLMALQLLADICLNYAAQAREMAAQTQDEYWELDLLQMAGCLEKITLAAPQTFQEGIQLYWLYALISGVVNYGRMDVALGNLLVQDLDSGLLTEERALQLLMAFWQMIADRHIFFNGRVIVGGQGRPDEANADRFALLAMEATRRVIETEPQLTLRFYTGQNPALYAKALDVISEGRTYPMLYNDDVNIPAVSQAFGVDLAEAAHYLPYGCGEYVLDHRSFGSPNCGFSMLKALEATLNNGVDPSTGDKLGLALGDFNSFRTYAELFAAYRKQIEHHLFHLAQRHVFEYKAEHASAVFLFASMLYDDCIEKGRSLVNRGPVYTGGIVETFGMVNTADSLAAIKQLVYEENRLTQAQMLAALNADFEGFEAEYRLMRSVPKYGNDDDYVDGVMQEVSAHIASACRASGERVGLDYFLVVNINNFANVSFGNAAGASADGRRAGAPLANGNTPTAGNDVKGVTAFMNSIVKPNPALHAGYVHNMKFSRQMFTKERPKLEALLSTYFAKGGTQAMITVVSRGDLENAMREPEKYRNLIVRVGGFSARFVELDRRVQMDILNRTLIE